MVYKKKVVYIIEWEELKAFFKVAKKDYYFLNLT